MKGFLFFIIKVMIFFLVFVPRYEVCDRAYTFLHAVYFEPSYCIEAIKPKLYEQVRALGKVKSIKSQLEHLLNYLNTCSITRIPK